jgi:hypothetical protein
MKLLEVDFALKCAKLNIIKTFDVHEWAQFLKEWNLKLVGEVAQLLQLASMELEVSKL